MNPILVKPEDDDRSQLVLMGKVDRELSRRSWRERAPDVWPVAAAALRELLAEYELVLLEGAGSPAETNLRSTDLSNMRAAHAADASVVLVADIDRGGAFAHLYGTWALLGPEERRRVGGFVLNKFRGDEGLLTPAPEELARATGMTPLGVLPFVDHGLPDEDGAAHPSAPASAGPRVAALRYPTASNLDELKPLEQVAELVWAQHPEDLDGAELVILPGSKHVAADLAWLRSRGLDRAICALAARRVLVLGICGGLQMLGQHIMDVGGVDGDAEGLGLLPVRTQFERAKRTEQVQLVLGQLSPPWEALSGTTIHGYEIRHGETTATGTCHEALPGGRGFARESVLGITVHGALEQPELLDALFGRRPGRSLDAVFEHLADLVEDRLDMPEVARLAGVA
jgi:adenosylcobyric acid synthase